MITKDSFLKALSNNKAVRPQDMELLVTWYALPGRAATAEQIVEATGAKRASLIVNNLGKRIAAFLEAEAEAGFSVVALEGTTEGNEAAWIMHEELAQALVEHGAVAGEIKAEAPVEAVAAEVVVEEKAVEAAVVAEEPAEEVVEAVEEGSLKAKLIEFDQQVIRAAYPGTASEKRLLNPAMINVLVELRPANKRVFQRVVPASLRKEISSQESKMFLNQVLTILREEA